MIEKWDYFINFVRNFFRERDYMEVSTPVLIKYPNLDSNIEPISLQVIQKGEPKTLWLQTSPEYSMKKLLSKHKRNIFQIAKVFRNNEWGRLHKIEFHMLEWYSLHRDYEHLIGELKDLLAEVLGYKEFEEITLDEAFKRKFGREIPEDRGPLIELLEDKGLNYEVEEDWETLFYRAFIEVERELGFHKPVFLKDFPPQLCALARIESGVAQRFELFVKGIELANGWTEETRPSEVRKRLEAEASKRGLPIDEDFIDAHKELPPCAGCSVGIDRLFMLYTGKESIEDIEL